MWRSFWALRNYHWHFPLFFPTLYRNELCKSIRNQLQPCVLSLSFHVSSFGREVSLLLHTSDSTSSFTLLWCILLRLLIICRTSSSFYYFELMQWMQVSKSQVSTSHKLECFNYTGTNNFIRLNTQCRSTLSAAVVREDVEGIVWAEAGHLKQVTSKYNPNSLTHCKTKTQPGCELETLRGLIQINRWDRLIWLTWNAS